MEERACAATHRGKGGQHTMAKKTAKKAAKKGGKKR
jgi:hypothetical protein